MANSVADEKSQLQFLRNRVKELESENAKLLSLLSACSCCKMEKNVNVHTVDMNSGKGGKMTEEERLQGCSKKSGHKYFRRYVALKVMYFGQRFYGFASEAQMDPTIECEIFKALKRTRLIDGGKKDIQFSRCGRTDKGVSSVGQVISLFLRSNHNEKKCTGGWTENILGKESVEGEIDYVRTLNKVLPKDIRVMGWSPAPIDLSARFSCLSREYKYFFWRRNLDLAAVEAAGKKFVGEHDFRNFCKMDANNVHNYKRRILQFEIVPCNEWFEGDELWAVRIKGTAFLWHQVRCMVAVLFLIGQGLESPDVIDALLDIDRVPRKPLYLMAPEIPLVLQSCEFEDLEFICSSDARHALHAHFDLECRNYKLQAAIYHEALLSSSSVKDDGIVVKDRTKDRGASYVPIMSRPTEHRQ